MPTTIKSTINSDFFLDVALGSMWHNMLFSDETLGSIKVRTMSIVRVTIQAL